MKTIVIALAIAGLGAGFARASLTPGALLNGEPGVNTTFTLYDDHQPPAGDLGSFGEFGDYSIYQLDLNVPVVTGYVVVLENGPSQDRSNWSDLVRFFNPDSQALLTSYDGPDAATFWADYTFAPDDNVVYIQETGGPYTLFTATNNDGVTYTYQIDSTAVPEPTTMIAGALLVLPFGGGALRRLRLNRAS
ncbi:MAG TPA: hypothetical protein VMB80_04170 [Candidatus Acidoferrum sp.]|nr:hypothetical protein [Candidatus Acidoferrum sp.]